MALEPDETGSATVQATTRSNAPRCAEPKLPEVTILVCSTCAHEEDNERSPTPGEQLFAATCAARDDPDQASQKGVLNIKTVECLGNCKRRLSAAIVTSDCWTYVFGDLAIDNAKDLLTGAQLMADSPNGLMPWRGRPQSLKSGMVARIPPIQS